jgi:phenylalanine-4-hydroxylase
MAKSSKYVAMVPDEYGDIHYSADQNAVWRDLFAQQKPNIERYCATAYLNGHKALDLPQDRVPQCRAVSEKLMDLTGWKVAPVPALIGFRQFFVMLAAKTFPAASFIRNRRDFDYIEEPDIFHEIFGHTPLLTDPRFANFSQKIGEAGQLCDPADYAWLIRLYWFTIEFGLIREDGEIKALGSGLASSPTELIHAASGETAAKRPFDVVDILRTPYRIDIHQPIYFCLDHADQLLEAAERDLLGDIRNARALGLHAATYPPKQKAG